MQALKFKEFWNPQSVCDWVNKNNVKVVAINPPIPQGIIILYYYKKD